MRILLFGKNGQVGHAFLNHASDPVSALGEVIAVGRGECDLTNAAAVRETIRRSGPDVIVNAAAYTAVDRAESDAQTCYAVNEDAPEAMAKEAAALGALLLHYSTDYVFDGRKLSPYAEDDPTGPLGVYGASKLAGEQRIAESGARYVVLRTSWVYGNHGANFMKTMLRLAAERPELRVVADQTGSPTSADAIAGATARILRGAKEDTKPFASGVYHMTAGGAATWFDFAGAIFAGATDASFARLGGPTLTPIATAEYPTPAKRPANSVLANDKFEHAFGFRLPDWREGLRDVLTSRAATLNAAEATPMER